MAKLEILLTQQKHNEKKTPQFKKNLASISYSINYAGSVLLFFFFFTRPNFFWIMSFLGGVF